MRFELRFDAIFESHVPQRACRIQDAAALWIGDGGRDTGDH